MDMPNIFEVESLELIQRQLSRMIIVEDRFRMPTRKVSGIDVAYKDGVAFAACVTIDTQTMEVLEEKTATVKVDFPYKPTFLWFREGGAMLRVVQGLDVEPDIFMVNGHGLAHPRRCGSASHFGVSTGKPSIGVAGSRLCGEYSRQPTSFGDYEPLMLNGDAVGWLVKPAVGKPIYVSPGHMVSLKSSVEIVLRCLLKHRFPEPIHLAHRLAENRLLI
ncbi:MAG: endonuclease V [Candidatus Bathyarchaeia archaeon]